MTKTIRTKLWNRADWPVWSLSTIDEDGVCNMNICTYVVPVSMEPKAFMVALCSGTKTLANVRSNHRGILQLLSKDQKALVRRFGYSSGYNKDKMKNLKEPYSLFKSHAVLDHCLGYAELRFSRLTGGGDHMLGYGEVCTFKNLTSGDPLTTHFLKE